MKYRTGFLSLGLLGGFLGYGPDSCSMTGSRMEHEFMNQRRLESILKEEGGELTGVPGQVEFVFANVRMACISDPPHDRMCIIAPIVGESEASPEQMRVMLEANFYTTLDGRYAIRGGLIYAAYIHPLSSLHDDEVRSALRQVANLVKSFGTSYSSGDLRFGRAAGD